MTKEEIQDRVCVLLDLGAIGNVGAWVAELDRLTAEYKRLERPQKKVVVFSTAVPVFDQLRQCLLSQGNFGSLADWID